LFIQENPVQILAQTEIFFFLFCLCLIWIKICRFLTFENY
jgi:hypothetical protein